VVVPAGHRPPREGEVAAFGAAVGAAFATSGTTVVGCWAVRREPQGLVNRVCFPREQGGDCQGHSRESAESRSRAEDGKAARTSRGHIHTGDGSGRQGAEDWRPAPPAVLHTHSVLVTREDGQHPPGNSSGPAESAFNAYR